MNERTHQIDLKLVQVVELNEEESSQTKHMSPKFKNCITDFHNVCLKNGKQATLTILADGKVDFYWNCKKVTTSSV